MKTLFIHLVTGPVINGAVLDNFTVEQFWTTAIGFGGQRALTINTNEGDILIPTDKVLFMRLEKGGVDERTTTARPN